MEGAPGARLPNAPERNGRKSLQAASRTFPWREEVVTAARCCRMTISHMGVKCTCTVSCPHTFWPCICKTYLNSQWVRCTETDSRCERTRRPSAAGGRIPARCIYKGWDRYRGTFSKNLVASRMWWCQATFPMCFLMIGGSRGMRESQARHTMPASPGRVKCLWTYPAASTPAPPAWASLPWRNVAVENMTARKERVNEGRTVIRTEEKCGYYSYYIVQHITGGVIFSRLHCCLHYDVNMLLRLFKEIRV